MLKHFYDPRIHLNHRLLPILVGVLLLLDWLVPYDGWLVLLTGLGMAWLLSYLWVRFLINHLDAHREMRYGWAQVGDRLEERFTLNNRGVLPCLWVQVVDHSSLPDYTANRVTSVDSHSVTRWITEGACTRRGLYRLGPTTFLTSDPLGLFRAELHDPRSVELMVTPPIVPLPWIEVAPGGYTGEGRPRPYAPEKTVSAAMVREYQHGDEQRWIHWRTSARKEKLYVRTFDGTPAGDWWIVLDFNQVVQVGSGFETTEELGVILAASIADRGIRLKRNVGLVVNGKTALWLPPRGGDGQRWDILRALALIAPGERSLEQLLASLRASFGKQNSMVLITADTSGSWMANLMLMRAVGIMPTLLLLDPNTFGVERDLRSLEATLTEQGIFHHLIPCQLLQRPEAQPGMRGRWDLRVTPSGKAVAVSQPTDFAWKEIDG
jgi:uncharacterized protein (DUF58 family)